jgi:hypothetical protein
VVRQQGDVLLVHAQRESLDRQDVKPVKEILPEHAFPDQRGEVTVCRSNEPDIRRDLLVAAQRTHLALCDGPQQGLLHSQGCGLDLVQEERAARGLKEGALSVAFGLAVCSFDVAEEGVEGGFSFKAPQLIATNGPSFLPDSLWMASAMSCLPVPVSP